MRKTKGVLVGIVFVLLGILIIYFGFSDFLMVASNLNQPSEIFKGALIGSILVFIGGLLAFGGAVIFYLTHVGKIFSYTKK